MHSTKTFPRFMMRAVWCLLCVAAGVGMVRSTDAHAGWFSPDEWQCSSLMVEFEISLKKQDGEKWDIIPVDTPPYPLCNLGFERDGNTIADEPVAQRYNRYDFQASFFKKTGMTLREGDLIKIYLEDLDNASANDYIGLVELTVNGRTTSGRSSNGLFEAKVTCEK